jgi:hypothetical protein
MAQRRREWLYISLTQMGKYSEKVEKWKSGKVEKWKSGKWTAKVNAESLNPRSTRSASTSSKIYPIPEQQKPHSILVWCGLSILKP